MSDSPRQISCWCDNTALEPFGPDYFHCLSCQTLVSKHRGESAEQVAHVGQDESGRYGKRYWFEHQKQAVGLPAITSRARLDLPERCVHWMRTLLTLKRPPARVQEIGSAHGAFVAMLKLVGYEAVGLELSPFIVDFAKATFDVPMLLGPIEQQSIAPASLDAVVMMDVLEHLPDPMATVRHIAGLLKEDGVFIVQTPRYVEGNQLHEMVARGDYFLNHMREPPEHLLLFSQSSAAALMRRVGLFEVVFEPPLFPQYDMYFVASRRTIARGSPADQEAALSATPGGRMVRALLDAAAERDLYLSEANKRMAVIEGLAAEIKRLQAT